MPVYPTGPGQNTPVPLLQPGVPGYAFGSLNSGTPTTEMQVTNVALTSNVATITVLVRKGNIPAVGSTMTVRSTSAASGAFNVTATITGVSINATTGIGTITYALVHADVVSVADAGRAFVPVPEVGETLTSGAKSQAFAIQNAIGRGYGISWGYTCPSAPVSISIQLEGAISNNDSEFTAIGTAQTAVSGYTEIFATVPELVNFVRLHVTASSGGTVPTIIGKLLQA